MPAEWVQQESREAADKVFRTNFCRWRRASVLRLAVPPGRNMLDTNWQQQYITTRRTRRRCMLTKVAGKERPMTSTQIKFVQTSFAQVATISATAADLFYDRLFEIAPHLRSMFPEDLAEQKK